MKTLTKTLIVALVLSSAVAIAQRRPFPPPSNNAPAQNLQNVVEAATRGEYRYVRSNGIPDHEPGEFPNRNNPNRISAQDYSFRLLLVPEAARTTTEVARFLFGIAVNGVPFDPGTAEFWNGDPHWHYEAKSGKIDLGLDSSNAHVQPTGAYHYHGLPYGLIKKLGGGQTMLLVGYAADGFPVYAESGYTDADDASSGLKKLESSYRVKSGTRRGGPVGRYDGTFVEDYEYVAGAGDLDECNGRYGVTPEFPGGTYYYVLTEDYPFIPRLFRGTPDASFRHAGAAGPPGGGPGGSKPFGPPPRRRRN